MSLELSDIQGIILHGYRRLPAARFVLLHINNSEAVRKWIGQLVEQDQITNSAVKPKGVAMNIAFTHAGLAELALPAQTLAMFSNEFQDGMTTDHRQRVLGDVDGSAPSEWDWGSREKEPVHILLMLYSTGQQELDEFYVGLRDRFGDDGLQQIGEPLETNQLPGAKEHFGFRDGLSQPVVEGAGRSGRPENTIKAGEFLLGYVNEYDRYAHRPIIDGNDNANGILPVAEDRTNDRDLARNGSYLVFRQLSQRVVEFWDFLDKQTSNREERIKLASKMVGRWPSGAPLVLAPDEDIPELASKNDFLYHHEDEHGLKCPQSAHVRRSNPRDSLAPGSGTQKAIEIGKRHRIIRRGRSYGAPVSDSMNSDDILANGEDSAERGLHFICFNANIARQFEFIQQSWLNSPKFAGLYSDSDPLIGAKIKGTSDTFSVPKTPVRHRVNGIPRFVEVRGGGYFFMPGMRALKYLASLS